MNKDLPVPVGTLDRKVLRDRKVHKGHLDLLDNQDLKVKILTGYMKVISESKIIYPLSS